MGSPINQELRELRFSKEKYQRVLSENLDLSDEDKVKINSIIEGIDERIDELLAVEDI